MIRYIYTRPIEVILAVICLSILMWGILNNFLSRKKWRNGNSIILYIAIGMILYATLLTRTPGDYELILTPFTPFATFTAAQQQPELYREMLMNVFLFFPLGLTLSNALPRKWHRWVRIALTMLVGYIFSSGIEYAQYRYALGMAEVDDVICNTLGAFIGSISLLIAHTIEKSRERVRQDVYKRQRLAC